ncbi:hypothetical protein FOCG_00420 [Fusarium oxysporum f. sp. radicis-lycopersici 26381]|uniref:Uncharacterized protein n=4 Tax=Fusarium oxysporum TaxID=5507 RepID=W9IWW9_FUSOX|nr:hypothetical protein FOXG_18277 [Fusarium oxysporum f. sp. lycopersici 4287]EWY97820.1 hypothetical protein FOYG_02578 [Fusarium oxysporum NRRL 32931]EWZ43900.1 hypothetical protein FOZG_04915 [Fusarium oxysporum Fo47]EWZ99231.1 hypothetical protein FOWG_02969 [Fusarium oxysporum f. sp. lycopersici MN25]EXK41259.1 hypothetical protein FOMG_04742 [Fusarium oxysporum f. sp. melonis 26406]EXL61230.1 hypothetical protein FOCG_00420 [Fusarium oxysporum f. sp. radicis-lycopersici 26381]
MHANNTFAKHRELKPKNAFKGSSDLPSGRGTIRSSSGSNTTLMASNWNVKGQRIKYSSTCSSHASVGRSNVCKRDTHSHRPALK